jgi:hypothetical protein
MTSGPRTIEQLTPEDFRIHPMWEFVSDPEDELVLLPCESLPVDHLDGRVIGTTVLLRNGTRLDATLYNLVCNSAELTQHVLNLAVYREGRWLGLARYHDFDYSTRGPEAFSASLGLTAGDVFPIAYDVSEIVNGEARAIKGSIPEKPVAKLSESELQDLIFQRLK